MRRANPCRHALALSWWMAAVAGCGSEATRADLVNEVWRDFDATYPSFALRGVDWNQSRDQALGQVAAAKTDGEVADAIGAMLLQLEDVHVMLRAAARTYQFTHCPRPGRFDAAAAGHALSDPSTTAGGHLGVGRLSPEVGYVRVSSFSGQGWGGEIDDALGRLSGIRGLVVDVRSNGGGDDSNARTIASRFATASVLFSWVRTRSGSGHDDLGPRVDRVLDPAGARFAGPVSVLIDGHVASSAESFVLMMRTTPQVLLVGEATCGASANPASRSLSNGWTYQVPTWLEYVPSTGSTLEVVGVVPDVPVASDAPGDDPILFAALTELGNRI